MSVTGFILAAAFAFAIMGNILGSPAAMMWGCALAVTSATLPLLASVAPSAEVAE